MPLETLLNKLLADSNSYFRIARDLHPLLNSPFGKDNNCIFILKECEREYLQNPALQNKFPWLTNQVYIDNRKNVITYDESIANAINNNLKFIKDFARENYLSVSEVDRKYLATALEMDLILITDDGDMITIATEFGIKVLRTLELLKMMLDSNFIDINKIKSITDFWVYNRDTPKDFKADCKNLFNLLY